MAVDVPMRFESEPLLWTVPDVYTHDECRDFIELIEAANPDLATNNPLYRNQDRIIVHDPVRSTEMFSRLRAHLPERIANLRLVGLNERLRMYRYKPGQQFAPHMDHWYRPNERQVTLHSVLVYFNADFEGGATRFMEQIECTVEPKPGLVAIFQHKIRHEGCEVLRGTKYALRTDVIYEQDDAATR